MNRLCLRFIDKSLPNYKRRCTRIKKVHVLVADSAAAREVIIVANRCVYRENVLDEK